MNRTLLTFIILTVLAFLLVLLPYGFAFSTHISENSQDWANFGSYVGGTLSPIIATLALFGLGLTIFQQKQQQQLSSLETAIRNIESDFEACLFKTEVNVSGHECNSYDILMSLAFPEWDKIIPNKNSIDLETEYSYFSDEIRLFETFGVAAGHLNQLRLYVNKHHELSKTNVLLKYYSRKYKTANFRLISTGYLVSEKKWESA